jgi:hypothetical protein
VTNALLPELICNVHTWTQDHSDPSSCMDTITEILPPPTHPTCKVL